MRRCPYPDCGWRAIAAGPDGASEQVAAHVTAEHLSVVEADIPEDAVEVHLDGEWRTVTREAALRLARDDRSEERRGGHDEQAGR